MHSLTSFSVHVLGVTMLRLAQKYGADNVYNAVSLPRHFVRFVSLFRFFTSFFTSLQLIRDFVNPAAAVPASWANVTFRNTLDLATGTRAHHSYSFLRRSGLQRRSPLPHHAVCLCRSLSVWRLHERRGSKLTERQQRQLLTQRRPKK